MNPCVLFSGIPQVQHFAQEEKVSKEEISEILKLIEEE